LDELPQLFNVLRGEMSLVGPRAHVLEEVDLYRDKHRRQFTIKPGLTGLTQVAQTKIPDLPFEEEIRLNTFYLENWSLFLDFRIIFQTVLVVLKPSARQKAYY
jgi:lipopolysaccharide/colanic/teichoic acid biosynthesis glycosyltransferase